MSAKWPRCLGNLFLLNKCSTMQIRPASTAIPDVTPRRVGKSDVNTAISGRDSKRSLCVP